MFEKFGNILLAFDPLTVAWTTGAFCLGVVLLTLLRKPHSEGAKIFFFSLIVVPVLAASLYLGGQTFYEVLRSSTGGPVHWHADFRIFNCGEEVDLIDPTGLSNRVGPPVIHEHGDNRIHVEGTILELSEVSPANFFEVIGGALTVDELIVPTNTGEEHMRTGEACSDGTTGVLQAFLWTTEGWWDDEGEPFARQRKLGPDFPEYIMKGESLVPPGDCIIFEFGEEKEKTRYLCEQYEAAEAQGDITIER